MPKSHVRVNSLAVVLLGSIVLWSGPGFALEFAKPKFDLGAFFNKGKDNAVCYHERNDILSVWTLNVKEHSPLDISNGHKNGLAPTPQTTYSALGKNIQDLIKGRTMRSLNGTIAVAKDEGARAAITRTGLISPNNNLFSVSHFECTSDEASSTPQTWTCNELFIFDDPENGKDFGVTPNLVFDLVDPSDEENEEILNACNFFQALPANDE